MKHIDKTLLVITASLLAMGIIMIFSSSAFLSLNYYRSPSALLQKHATLLISALILTFIVVKVDYHIWGKASYLIMEITMLLLVGVLIFGPEINGVKRWFSIYGFSFQPSEFAKLGIIIFFADFIANNDIKKFKKGLFPLISTIVGISVLMALQPSFNVLLVICATCFIMIFIGGAKLSHFTLLSIIFCIAIFFVMSNVSYAKSRLLGFSSNVVLNNSVGYQIRQSIYSIGSGGLFGTGLGNGRVKLLFIPYLHTDFIFSIIGEELGFLGTFAICALFFLLLLHGIRVGEYCEDRFGFLLATGISFMIFISTTVHIGVACGLLPTTGIPLPFISFGGSNLFSNLVAMGILLNISKTVKSKTTKFN